MTRKSDKKGLKLVLNIRDIEDSGTIFGFPVSIHTKKCCTFEKKSSKIGPIWRFGHLEPLCIWFYSGVLIYKFITRVLTYKSFPIILIYKSIPRVLIYNSISILFYL